jgi:hypothetical protein
MQIDGHSVEFVDCGQIGQAGPVACSLVIDGRGVAGRFDPSPLPFKAGILVPKRKSNLVINGYALCFIDLETLGVRTLSRVFEYMKLIRILDETFVEFNTTTYSQELSRVELDFRKGLRGLIDRLFT